MNLKLNQNKFNQKKNVIKIAGIESVDEIKKLTNYQIYTLNEYLKPVEGEYYWKDLLNMDVYNENNEFIGVIKEIRNFGADDTLIIDNQSSQTLIPFVKDIYIKSVDTSKGLLIVDWSKDEL